MCENYLVALYLRLSKEDEGECIDESNSITNQREFIKDYINRNEKLFNCETIEFCDDGYSGTNFYRPSVMDMLHKIKKGNINCVIVKDFSRFGRNYIEVGNYIHQVFPSLGVRFIAINDGYDSEKNLPSSEFIGVAFKNLVYDLYSKDLSEKIVSVRRYKAQQGKFIGAYAPYGYLKGYNQQLIVDEEAATIVKRIFNMAFEGVAMMEIARTLNKEQIPSPLMLRKSRKEHFPCYHINEKCVWKTSVISAILKDKRYVGDAVYGKVKPTNVGSRKYVCVAKKDWIIVPNTHEPIIARKIYEDVNSTFKKYSSTKKNQDIPLLGKIRCGGCNHVISPKVNRKGGELQEAFYKCHMPNVTNQFKCYRQNISEVNLEECVLKVLNRATASVADFDFKQVEKMDRKEDINELVKSIANNEAIIKKFNCERLKTYEAYKGGSLGKECFMEYKKSYDAKVTTINILLQQQKAKLCDKKEKLVNAPAILGNEKLFIPFNKLTTEVANTFVDTIYILPNGSVKILWKFNNPFAQALNFREDKQF